MSKEKKSKKPKEKATSVRIAYGYYSWHDAKGKANEAHEGDIIKLPTDSPALKQGLERGKFEKV